MRESDPVKKNTSDILTSGQLLAAMCRAGAGAPGTDFLLWGASEDADTDKTQSV